MEVVSWSYLFGIKENKKAEIRISASPVCCHTICSLSQTTTHNHGVHGFAVAGQVTLLLLKLIILTTWFLVLPSDPDSFAPSLRSLI